MKSIATFALAAFAAALAVDGCSSGTRPGAARDFALQDISGKKVSLSDFRGKPVLVNFWAVE